MSYSAPGDDVDVILEMIGNTELRNIHTQERRSAVGRAVRFLGVHSRMEVGRLIEMIEAHEAQLNVHTEPSDPDDLE